MAEQLGLEAILKFNGNDAVQGMNKANAAFGRMQAGAKTAAEGVKNIQKGFSGFGLLAGAVTTGMGVTVKKFADFEGQMGAVKAVLGKEAAPQFGALEGLAMKLGATTSFTAKQSAEAMENLARSGMNANQIMSAIGPTLAAAAADGMDLGQAADVVASNMKAFGLEASDATRIADALAFVSAKTNTNIVGLQEGMKFVAPVAKDLGISVEDTAASLGVLADIGLKNTLGGTALKNALLKIAAGAKGGRVEVGKFTAKIEKNAEGGVKLNDTFKNIVAKLGLIKDKVKRANATMGLLGMRGMGAAAAFDALGKDTGKASLLFDNMAKSAKGTSAEMQRVRLDNLHGDLTILSSSIDGFANSMGKTLKPIVTKVVKGPGGLTTLFGDTAAAFQVLVNRNKLGSVEVSKQLSGLNKHVVGFVKGFTAGIEGAKSVFKGFINVAKIAGKTLEPILGPLGFMGKDGSGVEGLTKMAIQLGAFGIGLKVTTSLISRMASVTKGTFQVLKGSVGMVSGYFSKFKGMQKIMSKIPGLGKVSKVVSVADKMTAQPVRVVNFDEMGGGLGGLGGGAGVGAGGAGGVGAGGGLFSTIGGYKGLSRLQKVTKGLGTGFGLLGAAMAGVQIGRVVDDTLGLSSAIANLHPAVKKSKEAVSRHERLVEAKTAGEQARMFGGLAAKGIGLRQKEGGPATTITRELVIQKLKQGALKDASAKDQKIVLQALADTLNKIPTAEQLAAMGRNQEIKVMLDGKMVGRHLSLSVEDMKNRGLKGSVLGAEKTKLSRLQNRK